MATAKLLLVAGGGGGGKGGTVDRYDSGGGGAGGLIYKSAETVTAGSYTITIGGGGPGATNLNSNGTAGDNSSAFGYTAVGGGYGGYGDSPNGQTGGNGGSGGGAGSNGSTTVNGGTATSGQGYNGGSANSAGGGGGGGGAGGAGSNSTSTSQTAGGPGVANSITGSSVTYAAGGAGGSATTDGTANTGKGGSGSNGGSTPTDGGSGGSGIFVIAYTTADFTHTGGDATGTNGSETWVKFTANGTLVLTDSAVAPTVTTSAVSDIASTTATGNGNVTADGGATISERGTCISTSANPTTSDTKDTAAGTTGAYTTSIDNLSAGTLYHVRAYAINSVGTSYGADVEFTTLAAPTVTTQAVSSIKTTTATGNGTVTADGGATVSERGVCWKTSTGPTTADSKANSGTGTGAYTVSMTGLTAFTTYYVKAYAINSVGTSYGSEVTFKTLQVTNSVFLINFLQ